MKGIIAAGGKGSRLYPLTLSTSKHLQAVNDKPMIYYPLTTLLSAGIREICIVGNKEELPLFKKLFGTGEQLGCIIHYVTQRFPNGIPEVIKLSEKILGKCNITLILGDNIISAGGDFSNILRNQNPKGASIFGISVKNPEEYGVVDFDSTFNIRSIIEKPKNPKSNFIVPGVYIYDKDVFDYVKMLRPSSRGELEITDLNNLYLYKKLLKLNILRRGSIWFDTGTSKSLQEASHYIYIYEKQSGIKIGCPEEAALNRNLINKFKFYKLLKKLPDSEYKSYLTKIGKDFFQDLERSVA